MKKKLRFSPNLIPLILSGEKFSTWRLWDDKNLSEGDIIDFLESNTKRRFATAELIRIIEKPMEELTKEDKKGHEKFKSDKEMCETYSKYYRRRVSPKTLVKVIWFKLIN